MADATIGSLPALSELDDNSLLVAEQGGSAQKLSGAQIKAFAVAAAEAEAAKAAQSATDAAAAQAAAETAQAAAEDAKTEAQSAQAAAKKSENNASSYASSAGFSANRASNYMQNAQNSADDAASSANSALTASRNSASSASSASSSATAANSAKTAAETAKAAAETAQEAAESAKADAESAKTAAASSATSSAASATAAGSSATDAAKARDAILNMIVSAITLNTGEPATVEKSVVDEVFKLTFGLPRGEKGEVGSPGRGITSITLKSGTHAAGTVDTYTVTFTDNTTYDFQVTNGANGFSPTITTSKSGKVTTVTVVDANGTQSFAINDGADGKGSGDMQSSVYDPTGKAQDIFAYVDDAIDGVTIQTDATPTQGSANPVQSGGVYTELGKKLDKTGDGSDVTAKFTAASSRTNIATGEKLSAIFGKIAKWLSDLKTVAFSGSYTDLTNKPTIPSSAADVGAVATTGDGSDVTANFTTATSRTNIATGEKLSAIFGKIAKWLGDLGTMAFKSSVAKSDLASGVQASLDKADSALQSAPVTSVNGQTGAVTVSVPDASTATPLMDGTASYGSGTTYARGNHRHPTDTTRVPTSRTVNSKALSSNITLGEMYSATLTAANWTTSGDWKTQTVTVTGLKATYNAAPFVDVSLTGTDATGDAELAAAWLGISETLIADTAANSITVKFPATVDTPAANIPITITTYD